MSGPVPTLGYSSKSQAAAALRGQGYTHTEIARKIGVERHVVGALIDSAQRARRPVAQVFEVALTLDESAWGALQQAAEARGTTLRAIAARLLSHTARDNLIDAILDDGGKP